MSELPQGWHVTSLGELSDYITSGSRDWSRYYSDNGVLFIRTQDINKNRLTSVENIARVSLPDKIEGKRTLVIQGDILITITGANVGKCALITEPMPEAYVSQSVALVRLSNPEFGRFIHYNLIAPSGEEKITTLEASAYGLGRPVLSLGNVRETRISLAPLNEQKRIADKLDVLFSRVDACRQRLDHIPPLLKRFRQAVLAAATSGELTAEEQSQEHPRKTLSKVIDYVKTGPFGSSLHKSDYVQGGIPVINPMHINGGILTPSDNMAISEQKANSLAEFLLKEGDIVIARRGIMGRCAVVRKNQSGWLCGTGSMVIHPNADTLPDFLQLCLSSPQVVEALEADAVGSTMINLNQRILLRIDLIIPPIQKQMEIVRRVKILFAYADKVEARLNVARNAVERAIPALLAKAFRGELVPQYPNDEPAAALLQLIRAAREKAAPSQPTKTRTVRTMPEKMTSDTLCKAIKQLPNDAFTFEQLRERFPDDYESLKLAVFTLLGEAEPTLKQEFDVETRAMRLRRTKK